MKFIKVMERIERAALKQIDAFSDAFQKSYEQSFAIVFWSGLNHEQREAYFALHCLGIKPSEIGRLMTTYTIDELRSKYKMTQ